MNDLVKLVKNKNFPAIFDNNDLSKINMDKDQINLLLKEALKNEWIINIYRDIYTLGKKYRYIAITMAELSQKIIKDSYVSTQYVLSKAMWIPEAIYGVTSVLEYNEESINYRKWLTIKCNKYGKYMYDKLYENPIKEGIYIQKTFNGEFKCAKPLRALCDLLYLRNDEYTRIDELEAQFRMKRQNMEEDLKSEDFDELQGKFNIPLIEKFLSGIRKELRL